jgi:hypothetical protein
LPLLFLLQLYFQCSLTNKIVVAVFFGFLMTLPLSGLNQQNFLRESEFKVTAIDALDQWRSLLATNRPITDGVINGVCFLSMSCGLAPQQGCLSQNHLF